MAASVLTTATILVGTAWTGTAPGTPGTQTVSGTISSSTDISAWVSEVGLPFSVNMVEGPNFGSGGYMLRYPGLKDAQVDFGFINDYAAASLDVILRSTLGLGTLTYIDVKPTSSARSATNPSYVFAAYLSDYKPVMGGVGALSAFSVSWPTTGQFAVLTS